MLLLVRLYKDDIDEEAMRDRAQTLDLWTSVLSEALCWLCCSCSCPCRFSCFGRR